MSALALPFVGFLEAIGTSELLTILIVALIIFGPRKLPELGRSLGKGLGEFKRASDDLKRTWEDATDLEPAGAKNTTVTASPSESKQAQPSIASAEIVPVGAAVEGSSVAA